MCHLPCRLEPDLLMEGTSHTATSLRKAVTTLRSKLRLAHTIPKSAAVEEEEPPPRIRALQRAPTAAPAAVVAHTTATAVATVRSGHYVPNPSRAAPLDSHA
jgi:hypothetical protein